MHSVGLASDVPNESILGIPSKTQHAFAVVCQVQKQAVPSGQGQAGV